MCGDDAEEGSLGRVLVGEEGVERRVPMRRQLPSQSCSVGVREVEEIGVGDAADAFAREEDPVDVVFGQGGAEHVVFEADGFEEEGRGDAVVGRSVLHDRHASQAVCVELRFQLGRQGRFAVDEAAFRVDEAELGDELLADSGAGAVGADEEGAVGGAAVAEADGYARRRDFVRGELFAEFDVFFYAAH